MFPTSSISPPAFVSLSTPTLQNFYSLFSISFFNKAEAHQTSPHPRFVLMPLLASLLSPTDLTWSSLSFLMPTDATTMPCNCTHLVILSISIYAFGTKFSHGQHKSDANLSIVVRSMISIESTQLVHCKAQFKKWMNQLWMLQNQYEVVAWNGNS